MKASSQRSNGGPVRRHPADPTPEEIQQRIAEVHRIRLGKTERKNRHRRSMERIVLAAIATTGPMTSTSIASLVDYSRPRSIQMLGEMADAGLLVRVGKANQTSYTLPRESPGAVNNEPGLISNDEAYRRIIDVKVTAP